MIGLAIGISNGLGDGIRQLIYAPFHNLQNVNFTGGDEALAGGLGVGAALGLFGILTLGLMAALALFTGLLIIVLRQIVVILLAILSPIALVMYILPGTEKAWKMWWSSFWGALIMFPLIEAFIALGSVFSKIATSAGSTGILDKIIAYIAIYLPYFLLPMTLRLSGGMMQAVGGVVARSGSKIQGGLSKRRAATAAANRQELKAGTHFNNNRVLGRVINPITAGVGTGPRGWRPGGKGEAARARSAKNAESDYMKNDRDWQALQSDVPALGLARRFGSEQEARQNALNAHAARMANGMSLADSNQQLADDNRLIDRASPLWKSRVAQMAVFDRLGQMGGAGQFDDSNDVHATAARIAGGNNNLARTMIGEFEFNAGRAGSTFIGRVNARPDAPPDEIEYQRWRGADVGTQISGPPQQIQYFIRFAHGELNNNDPDAARRAERRERGLVMLNEMRRGADAGIGPNISLIREELSRPELVRDRGTALRSLQAQIEREPFTDANTPGARLETIMVPVTGTTGQTQTVGTPPTNVNAPETGPVTIVTPPAGEVERQVYGPFKETTEERLNRLSRPVFPPPPQPRP